MPAFSKMSIFPVGYFRATTQWLLRERRDVVARIDTIEAELIRIGHVNVSYMKRTEGANILATEVRTGFTVTKGSSLARLVQAYIATGGNPFDISGFLHPGTTQWAVGGDNAEGIRTQQYPGGGFVAPKTVDYNNPMPEVYTDPDAPIEGPPKEDEDAPPPDKTGYEGYEGGYIQSHKYYPGRMGGRMDRGAWDHETVLRVTGDTRKWANKEIKAKLQDMEWRIIKLSDLHEQLRQERDDHLMEAFAGTLDGMDYFDDQKQDPARLCQAIIADMYALFFDTNAVGAPVGFSARAEVGYLQFAFADDPADALGPMG